MSALASSLHDCDQSDPSPASLLGIPFLFCRFSSAHPMCSMGHFRILRFLSILLLPSVPRLTVFFVSFRPKSQQYHNCFEPFPTTLSAFFLMKPILLGLLKCSMQISDTRKNYKIRKNWRKKMGYDQCAIFLVPARLAAEIFLFHAQNVAIHIKKEKEINSLNAMT